MISLKPFDKHYYRVLISWIDSAETLMQFAGPAFSFPLTNEQLDKSLSDKKRIAFIIIDVMNNSPVGYAEIYSGEENTYLGRIIIGDKRMRGQGLGQKIVTLLLDFAFTDLKQEKLSLNVFDWNHPAIKCYEKAGFEIIPGKEIAREINGHTWIALRMTIDKKRREAFIKNKCLSVL
ncbi:MAG: hypothetical protein JWN76_725 [Chitinophagaceae bacterium]|nr:hypothetical protein [Chitinophagaceae bacterium]